MPQFIYFTDRNGSIGMQECTAVLATYEFSNQAEAEAYQQQLATHYGTSTLSRPKRATGEILHVGTGKTYPSAAAAAEAFAVTRSAMSQHLNHPDRYAAIKGHIFKRV